MFPCSALLNFILVEVFPLYVYMAGYYSIVRGTVLISYSSTARPFNLCSSCGVNPKLQKLQSHFHCADPDQSPGDFSFNDLLKSPDCKYDQQGDISYDDITYEDLLAPIRTGIVRGLFSFNLHFADAETGYNPTGNNYATFFFYSGVLVVVSFWLITLVLLALSGACHFNEGAYLAFTWKLKNMLVYRLCGYALLAHALVSIVVAVFLLQSLGPEKAVSPLTFLMKFAIDIGLLLYGVIYMLQTHTPAFSWQSQDFERMMFKRSLLDMAIQSNDVLSGNISEALLSAIRNDFTPLENLLDDEDSNEAMTVLLATKENDLQEGEEEEDE